MYGPKKMSCISDNMTNVYAEWVSVVQFCNSLRICCISAGGAGIPPGPPPPPLP